MPVISAKIIQRPRKQRRCDWCRKLIDGPQLRLYGNAEQEDKPYVVYLHRKCTNDAEVAEKLGEQP